MKASTVRTRVASELIRSRSRCASLLLALLPVATGAPEPRYGAPTLRDRIGRIRAPVYIYINGQGPVPFMDS